MGASVTVQGGGLDRNLLTALKLTWESEYGRELSRGAAQKPRTRTWLSTGGGGWWCVYSIYRSQTQAEGRRANRKSH